MTKEEYRNYVYNQYDTVHSVFMNSPERCYELINDRQEKPTNVRYSTNNHYYKIKW